MCVDLGVVQQRIYRLACVFVCVCLCVYIVVVCLLETEGEGGFSNF